MRRGCAVGGASWAELDIETPESNSKHMVYGPWFSMITTLAVTNVAPEAARYDGVRELQLHVDTAEE